MSLVALLLSIFKQQSYNLGRLLKLYLHVPFGLSFWIRLPLIMLLTRDFFLDTNYFESLFTRNTQVLFTMPKHQTHGKRLPVWPLYNKMQAPITIQKIGLAILCLSVLTAEDNVSFSLRCYVYKKAISKVTK